MRHQPQGRNTLIVVLVVAAVLGVVTAGFTIVLIVQYGYADFGNGVVAMVIAWLGAVVLMGMAATRWVRRLRDR